MGKADMAMSEYLENRKRFADLFNGILFQGKQVIREEELSEASPSYRFREQGEGSGRGKREGKLSGRSRDVKMRLKSGEVLRVLAVENQNQVDYTMPLRCMEYDALEYRKQLSEHKERNRRGNYRGMTGAERLCGMRKEEKLFPVYTICLYHGEKVPYRAEGAVLCCKKPKGQKSLAGADGEGGRIPSSVSRDCKDHVSAFKYAKDLGGEGEIHGRGRRGGI